MTMHENFAAKTGPSLRLSICDRHRLAKSVHVIGKKAIGLANKAHRLTAWQRL
jgi:hypothetical protein